MNSFNYILNKILNSKFTQSPFEHLYIADLFKSKHFDEITKCPEIELPICSSDEELFGKLFDAGYKIIKFPGCIADVDYYIRWHNSPEREEIRIINNTACEGFGVTLRLITPKSAIIQELKEFIESSEFLNCLCEKFNLDLSDMEPDNGIQKYLDGYEISPHPDIRKKSLTYMVNINSTKNSSILDHHTRYLRLKDKYRYIYEFWHHNTDVERCWLPWNWCEIEFEQKQNNSIVVFSPSNDSLHAVKANYNHLAGQRTQLYGNLWSRVQKTPPSPSSWQKLDLVSSGTTTKEKEEVRDEEFRELQKGALEDQNIHRVKFRD